MCSAWTRVATREALSAAGILVVRPAGRQIALFDTAGGIRACNNRCPHEGYPLSEGSLDAKCVLTCNWHNWKFDLASGDNLYDGERLRTYPVQVRGEAIWVDLAEPPFEARREQILASLRDAFQSNDYERMARELGRLRLLGADPLDAARAAIEWSWERLEFGWTHAYAGLADWLELAARLVEHLGASVAEAVLLPLVRQIVFAQREDLIPEFRGYAAARARFVTPATGGGDADVCAQDWRGLGIDKALERTVAARAAPASALFDALLGANANQLLAFDMAQQGKVRIKVQDNVGWLDFTHPVTFAEAAGALASRHPSLWPDVLLQLACFAGRNARYTVPRIPLDAWAVRDAGAFFAAGAERVLDHDADEFIVSVHRIKTLLASEALSARGLSDDTATALLAGVNRYLHSPLRLKHVRRTVHQALRFVGKDG